MLNLTVNRQKETEDSILGKLECDGAGFCYTLENKAKAIPEGVFEIRMRPSNRFKRNMPFLLNVPGREAIEIHPGNTYHDSDGCILVGYVQGDNNIANSRACSDDLNKIFSDSQQQGEKITITINDIREGD